MIEFTAISDYPYYWFISSQNKTKSKLQIQTIRQNFEVFNFEKNNLRATHLLKLLDKMCKYEMNPAWCDMWCDVMMWWATS